MFFLRYDVLLSKRELPFKYNRSNTLTVPAFSLGSTKSEEMLLTARPGHVSFLSFVYEVSVQPKGSLSRTSTSCSCLQGPKR